MKYIASCSFGKDSLAMVLMLIERGLPLDEVVFYDTGMEFQVIYDLRDAMLPIFQQHGIKYTTLYPDNPFLYDMLERPVKGRERRGYGWCGGLCRWGTTCKLRTAPAAHPQMREVAIPLLHQMRSQVPVIFDDIEEATHETV